MHTQNLIIGFGKAGKTLAADLAKHGQQVVLVEQSAQMYGGTCINIGCIPSKKLIVESEQRGHNTDKAAVFAAAMNAKNTLIPKLRAANFAKLDNLDGVTVLNAPGTIDADYRGEIGVILINLSQEAFVVNGGDRIAQLIVARHEQIAWRPVESLDETERGAGGFGHTGH